MRVACVCVFFFCLVIRRGFNEMPEGNRKTQFSINKIENHKIHDDMA